MPASPRLLQQPRRLADLLTKNEWAREHDAYKAFEQAPPHSKDFKVLSAFHKEVDYWRDLLLQFNNWTYDFLLRLNANREIAGFAPVKAGSYDLENLIHFDRWQRYYERFVGQRGVLFVRVQSFTYPNHAKTGKQGHIVRGYVSNVKKEVVMTLAQHLLNGDDSAQIGARKAATRKLRREQTGGTLPAACRLSWYHSTLRTSNGKEAFAVAVVAYDPYYAQQQMAMQAAATPEAMAQLRAEFEKLAKHMQPEQIHVPEPTYHDPVLNKVVPISEYRQD